MLFDDVLTIVVTFYFLTIRLLPTSTLFPYTTLFRSISGCDFREWSWRQGGEQRAARRRRLRQQRDLRSARRSEEHTSELQSRLHLVCRLLLEKKKKINIR